MLAAANYRDGPPIPAAIQVAWGDGRVFICRESSVNCGRGWSGSKYALWVRARSRPKVLADSAVTDTPEALVIRVYPRNPWFQLGF